MTPELRFDADGFVDLSVFADTEPDVLGHGPGVLDPALARDRDLLDRTFERTWISGALHDALQIGAGAGPDDQLAPLVPPTTGAPAGPSSDPGGTAREPASTGDDDIDLDSIRHLVDPRPTGVDAGGDEDGHDR